MPTCTVCGEWQPGREAQCSNGHDLPTVTVDEYAAMEARLAERLPVFYPAAAPLDVAGLARRIVDAAGDGSAAVETVVDEIGDNWEALLSYAFEFEEFLPYSRLPRGLPRAERRRWIDEVFAGRRTLRRGFRAAVTIHVVDPEGRDAYLVGLQDADIRTRWVEVVGVFPTVAAADAALLTLGVRSAEEFDRWPGQPRRGRSLPVYEQSW